MFLFQPKCKEGRRYDVRLGVIGDGAWEGYAPADGKYYRRFTTACHSLMQVAIDQLWLTPGPKAGHHASNGYGTYDLNAIGEFEQREGWRMKWGNVEDLMQLGAEVREQQLGLLRDAVLNHKAAADLVKTYRAVAVNKEGKVH